MTIAAPSGKKSQGRHIFAYHEKGCKYCAFCNSCMCASNNLYEALCLLVAPGLSMAHSFSVTFTAVHSLNGAQEAGRS